MLKNYKEKANYILAIESSCDESSICLIKDDQILKTITFSQENTFQKLGGVIPEVASRLHERNLPLILDQLKTNLGPNFNWKLLNAVAVTTSPGLIGCLQIGLQFAKTICFLFDVPLIAVNHLIGHIYSIEINEKIKYPCLGLIISGGNTQLILMNKEFDFKVLGQTKDDAIGECFDKVAKVLKMPYPGGPKIEELAKLGQSKYNFPVTNLDGYDFSYSGLKSSVLNLLNSFNQKKINYKKEDIAKSFQKAAINQLLLKLKQANEEFKIKNLIVVGGVSANNYLRKKVLSLDLNVKFPEKKYCPDNAAMIAKIGYQMFLQKKFSCLTIDSSSQKKIVF